MPNRLISDRFRNTLTYCLAVIPWIAFGQEISIDREDTFLKFSWQGDATLYRSQELNFAESLAISETSPHFEDFEQNAFYRLGYSHEPENPNILLIIVDDWGIDSSPLYNERMNASQAPMPVIDSLAQSGALFANAYAQPTCSPTRATMITGRFSYRHGIGAPVSRNESLPESEMTLPDMFAAANSEYAVAAFGKWHQTAGTNGTIDNTPNTIGGWPHYSGSLGGGVGDYYNWRKVVNGVATTGVETYPTTDTINDAVEWIEDKGAQPWFAWVALNAAHTPFHSPPESLHSYDGLPETPTGPDRRPAYEAALESLDTEIGRLLESVDRDNAYIILIGDNGTPGAVVQEPFETGRAKGSLYEGGTHVPMIVAGPGIDGAQTEVTLVHCVDVFATVLDASGIEPEQYLPEGVQTDSVSLIDVIEKGSSTREYILCESFGSMAGVIGKSIRIGQHKLIRYETDGEEFYDLATDENEENNLPLGSLTAEQQESYDQLSSILESL